jgi:hypothetical protein
LGFPLSTEAILTLKIWPVNQSDSRDLNSECIKQRGGTPICKILYVLSSFET